jgi:release factor glutamine methyltransferase
MLLRNVRSITASIEQEARWLLDEKYGGIESPQFIADLERLADGEPLDYLIGSTPFFGATIGLSERPLIPRAETEYWVRELCEYLRQEAPSAPSPLRILDVFSGSGCIGIALALTFPDAQVDLAEKSPSAIRQIGENLKENGLDEHAESPRVRVFQSDVFEGVPMGQYDVITANPPYIALERQEHVQPSVLAYEPHEALFADRDGLAYIETLVAKAPEFLAAGGLLAVEFDAWQKERIATLLGGKYFTSYTFRPDQYGRDRVVWIRG